MRRQNCVICIPMPMKSNVKQGGLNMTELAVVIAILGFLAAFAVPRFASLEGETRRAATQSIAGGVRSGAAFAHTLWLAEGDPSATTVTVEGTAITMSNGCPDAATIASTLSGKPPAGFTVTVGATTTLPCSAAASR